MKHRYSALLFVTATLVGSGCTAPSDQSIIISTARAPGTSCDFSDATLYVEYGALDLSVLPINHSYFQIFSWENDLENISVTVTSQITSETPNTFIATTINDAYSVPDALIPTPPKGLVSISAAIGPGATFSTSDVGVDLLTAGAAHEICGDASLTDNCPGFTYNGTATLLVTFNISGALVGGSAAQTNTITYPLYLFKGGNVLPNGTCAPGYVAQTTSCGIPGRDIPYCVAQ